MNAPVGIEAIRALYGDERKFVRDDGTVSPLWEARMVKVPFPIALPLGWAPQTRAIGARVNEAIAPEVGRVFASLFKEGLWETALNTYDGAYAWRTQRGSVKLSTHSYGAALDFNAATNGLGSAGDMSQRVVDVFEGHGWIWGGRWVRRPDPMHFQFAEGY